jgi:hypothetical protein
MQTEPRSACPDANASAPEKDEKWAETEYDLAYDYYFKGDWQHAERHIRDAIQVNAFEPKYRLLSAQIYCARGWLSMAFSELHILKMQDPENGGARSLELLLKAKLKDKSFEPRRRVEPTTGWRDAMQKAFAWLN